MKEKKQTKHTVMVLTAPSCLMQGHRKDTVPSEVGKLEQGPAWGTQGHTDTHEPRRLRDIHPQDDPVSLENEQPGEREIQRLTGHSSLSWILIQANRLQGDVHGRTGATWTLPGCQMIQANYC